MYERQIKAAKKAKYAYETYNKVIPIFLILSVGFCATGIYFFRSNTAILIAMIVALIALPTFIFIQNKRLYNEFDEASIMLRKKLWDNDASAEEILRIARENKLDLEPLALRVRCVKELGMESSEAAARDGVFPPLKK